VETVNSVAVFKKGYRSAYRLIDRQGFITSSESGKIDLKSDAAALEYTYARGLAGELPVLELTARVTKTRTTQREYMPCVEIANKEGRLIKKFLVAPVRIYPFRNWQVYEGIVIRSKIYLPKEFNNDDIRVTFLFVPIT